jgi:hypothetical protein
MIAIFTDMRLCQMKKLNQSNPRPTVQIAAEGHALSPTASTPRCKNAKLQGVRFLTEQF